jgi:hypothetical protein
MHWQVTQYSYLLPVVAAMSAALVFFAWRRRGTPGAEPLALLMTGVCTWAAGYALEQIGPGLSLIFCATPILALCRMHEG